jgi:hypothetical protein
MGNDNSRVAAAQEVLVTPSTTPAVILSAKKNLPASASEHSSFHPNSSLPISGYQGALSDKQQHALDELRAKVRALELTPRVAESICSPAEDEDGLLLRFLRARHFAVPKSLELLQQDLEWRQSLDVRHLAERSEEEVLGCDPALFAYYIPGWYESCDLQGRPINWQKWGDLRVDELLRATTHEKLVLHHIWQQEGLMRRLAASSKAQGVWIGQCVTICDAKHWHPGLATRAAMGFLREISHVDSAHYPERMGCVVVINAPYTLSGAWAIISAWLDPVTRAKVQIISSERYWKPLLESLIAPENIPVECGGTATFTLRDLKDGTPAPAVRAVAVSAAAY